MCLPTSVNARYRDMVAACREGQSVVSSEIACLISSRGRNVDDDGSTNATRTRKDTAFLLRQQYLALIADRIGVSSVAPLLRFRVFQDSRPRSDISSGHTFLLDAAQLQCSIMVST
jgi:hypothetical protein